MSVLSRYYFVFLLFCFILLGVAFIRDSARVGGFSGGRAIKGQQAITVLFALFAFPMLALEENFAGVASVEALIFAVFVLLFAFAAPLTARKFFKRHCPLLTNIMIFMLVLGFVVLQRLSPALASRQLVFASMGFVASLFIPLVFGIFKNFEKLEKLYMLFCLLLLVLVPLATGLGSLINIPLVTVDQFGAARWIEIAGMTFQPSELAGLIFLLYLSAAFRTKPNLPKLAFTGAAAAAIIAILVFQRNLGGALMFFVVFMVMLYAATGSNFLFAAGLGAMSVASVVSYQIFPHIRVRVAAFNDPWGDISNTGFQITQSLFAIATPGPFGAGLGRGLPNRIPVVERDVIFAAVSEEFGWLFALLLIALYVLMLIRGLDLAKRAKRPLYAIMTLGLATFLAFQAFLSIGGNIKFIPMTGITLPFISYGGSSVVVCILMMGMLNWLNGQLNDEEEEWSIINHQLSIEDSDNAEDNPCEDLE
jgi:cell division protein FtsW (lipid II flippase)